jgi:outer membrane protein OmpA-like peptidoglycan-associated protein
MKKLFLMLAAATFAANVSAQGTAITSNKFGDNWYIGANVGAATPQTKWKNGTEDWGFMKGFAPKLGVRVGKNLTTVFGLAADADVYMLSKSSNKSGFGNKTFVNSFNLSLLGTFNLNNLFAGYQGEPRAFEVIALGGLGWGHAFGGASKANALTSKAALDFAFNLGAAKALQIYVEPALVIGQPNPTWKNPLRKLNGKWNGIGQISVGVNYKFGNSNGSHNFMIEQLRDQAEIDGLNAKINELRADNKAKDGKIAADGKAIADLKAQLAACQARPAQTIIEERIIKEVNATLQPIVIFGQGKTTVDAAGMASCEMVAKYMKNHPDSRVKILGYASPEGSKEVNDRIAKQRAESVKNVLVKKYKIAASRLEAEGQGATDKLSTENDFNRVAKFIDLNNIK